MPIRSKSELKKAAEQAGDLLQQIHDYCAENNLNWATCDEAKVRFPRGFIRQAGVQRMRLRFIQNQSLRDNLAYTLILSDVVLWVKLRTDLWGTPKHMMTKLYAFLIGTLCESVTKEYLVGRCGQNFKKRNEYLLRHNIIDSETKDNLDWLWDLRNRMHLFQLGAREYENEYTEQCHNRCVVTFRQLIGALSTDWRQSDG
jgi:hypothetical protein